VDLGRRLLSRDGFSRRCSFSSSSPSSTAEVEKGVSDRRVIDLPASLTDLGADDRAVAAIALARLLLPLLILRVPLVIVAALALDAADNSLLERFSDIDLGPDGPYQSFDKALDIYYLAIAYLATMRNWTSDAAFRIGRFLFYYRLVGVFLFEVLDSRAMLLVFPNTFEYFFIAYELVRLCYQPWRCPARFWLATGATLWVVVKLPQEYWTHVEQGDFTDSAADHPVIYFVCALVVLALAAVLVLVVRPRLPDLVWGWQFAAGQPGYEPAEAHARHAQRLRRREVLWGELAEKAVLLGLLAVVFASILPGVTATWLEVAAAAAAIVCANTAISIAYARSERLTLESAAAELASLLAVNLGLVYLASRLIGDRDDFPVGEGLFFACLGTLILWLYDAYKPLADLRFAGSERYEVGLDEVPTSRGMFLACPNSQHRKVSRDGD
jgi:hypothetical protein